MSGPAFLCFLAVVIVSAAAMFFCGCFMDDGCYFHPGWKPFNPKVEMLCKHMVANPAMYEVDRYTLSSDAVCIWIANGWSFFRDYRGFCDRQENMVGVFSFWDRFRFRRALGLMRYGNDGILKFQHALRQQKVRP